MTIIALALGLLFVQLPAKGPELAIFDYHKRTDCSPYQRMLSPMDQGKQFVAFTCPNGELRLVLFQEMPSGNWIAIEAIFPEAGEPEHI